MIWSDSSGCSLQSGWTFMQKCKPQDCFEHNKLFLFHTSSFISSARANRLQPTLQKRKWKTLEFIYIFNKYPCVPGLIVFLLFNKHSLIKYLSVSLVIFDCFDWGNWRKKTTLFCFVLLVYPPSLFYCSQHHQTKIIAGNCRWKTLFTMFPPLLCIPTTWNSPGMKLVLYDCPLIHKWDTRSFLCRGGDHVCTTRLINTHCQENPSLCHVCCLLSYFIFAQTFVLQTNKSKKKGIRPSFNTDKQAPHSRWLVGYENNEDDPLFHFDL